MPSDSGHSFNRINEAEGALPAVQGDTPELDQELVTPGILVGSADRAVTPIPDPITPLPEVEGSPFITDLSDVLAAYGGKGGKVSGDTPRPGKGLRPLHPLRPRLVGTPLHPLCPRMVRRTPLHPSCPRPMETPLSPLRDCRL